MSIPAADTTYHVSTEKVCFMMQSALLQKESSRQMLLEYAEQTAHNYNLTLKKGGCGMRFVNEKSFRQGVHDGEQWYVWVWTS